MKIAISSHEPMSGAAALGPSSAELMSDSAVYRRTPAGQRALLRADGSRRPAEMRLLARFNGYTDLRRLIDLSPGDAREMPGAIRQLFAEGLIELVVEPASEPRRSSWR
jgi:hypothetical protein